MHKCSLSQKHYCENGIYDGHNAGGNNLNYSKDEIAAKIKEKVDYNIINSEMKDKDLRHFIVNFDKIEKLGFIPKKTVDEGIDELLRIYNFYEYYSHYKTIWFHKNSWNFL